MALTITNTIANMTTQWLNTCSKWNDFVNDLYMVGQNLIDGYPAIAGMNLQLAAGHYGVGLGYFFSASGTTVHRYLRDCLNKINTDWPSGGSVSMDSILNAMLLADYDQLQKFIGIEDAYRSAIWDQPFNAEFYAALANGFRP
jgi:hypothetical protein